MPQKRGIEKYRRLVLWVLLVGVFIAMAGNALFPRYMPWYRPPMRVQTEPVSPLVFEGVPQKAEAGRIYTLTIRLDAFGMVRAGFRLTVDGCNGKAGTLSSDSAGVTASGATAATPDAGVDAPKSGGASWYVDWTAPKDAATPCTVNFALRGTAKGTTDENDVVYGRRRFTQVAG
jgi:hypothetical protein